MQNEPVIALCGNPNVGKSTLFNALTGMKQHTGNWSGKTVSLARGICTRGGKRYGIVDLPGTYSLLAHSKEEEIASGFIADGNADAAVVVCDATCLARSLTLALQVLTVCREVVLCINLMDEARKRGLRIDCERLERLLGADKKIIRILPNTACAVGQGVVLYCANGNVTDGDLAAFCALMAAAGIVDPISEALIDAGCAITGCGPAFAYMFIEALADGGVKCGLPRAKAIRYAAQMLAGSAEMVLQSGKHPEQLKDEVCSPGGSTIAGVDALEQHGFRGSCIAAVDAAFEKTRQLG